MIISNSYVQHTQYVNKTNATASYTQNTKPIEETSSKLEEMQEKYKDVYTPIPETYSKADEDLQTSKIYEAYPDYVSPVEIFNKINSINGVPVGLGQVLTLSEREQIKTQTNEAYSKFGGVNGYASMNKDVQDIRDNYPINNWGKDESIENSKELSRFYNAAVYEGLEGGKTSAEAGIGANRILSSFMDTSYTIRNFMDTLANAGKVGSDSTIASSEERYPKVDFNDPFNNTMDLRKYGIEERWEQHDVIENQNGMIKEIEKKIGQFQFMLNNESLIKGAYTKLDASAQDLGNNAGYKKLINEQYMPIMKEGLNIFNNYKIYDSIDTRA